MSTVTIPSAYTVKSSIRSQAPSVLLKSPCSLSSLKSISEASSLKVFNHFRASAMAGYKVKLIGPEGQEHEFDAPDDTYILESAVAAGVELPYECAVGACAACTGRMESGEVDQSDGSFLEESQKERGYVLTCVSYPRGDCIIHTHKQREFMTGAFLEY